MWAMMVIEMVAALLCVAAVGIRGSESGGFNITQELDGYPQYSDFNDVLTKSGLADSINARNSLTVCALTNAQMAKLRGTLSGSDASDLSKVAALVRPMILLTFIDPTDPNTARSINGNQQVTSMYQAAGAARTEEGIANLTTTASGKLQIVASGGSNATITKSVKLIGYNLSIVEVSDPLMPTGVLGTDENAPVVSVVPTPPAESPKAASSRSSSGSGQAPAKSGAQPATLAPRWITTLATALPWLLLLPLIAAPPNPRL